MFKDISANIDIIPLQDQPLGSPFPCLVLNLNLVTLLHKDKGDKDGCIIAVLGPHSGGELCISEAGLVLELIHGDWTVISSQKLGHFNLHYKGKRASLVIHVDKSAVSYQKDAHGWDGNDYFL